MVDIKQIITYFDMFGTKNTFYTNHKPKLYTLMGGILTILSFSFCVIVFLYHSLDDFKRTSPITSTSYFPFDVNQRKIKFGEKKIWIPWRIADHKNLEYINHTGILFPIAYYYHGKKENNTINFKTDILNYKLCSETSIKQYSNYYILNVPLNKLYCIEMDDLEIGGSWTTDFLNYVGLDLFYCKDGIDYNETNPNCTSYEKLMDFAGAGNALELEIFFPEVQFQPANLSNPIIVKYNQYYYHLSRFSNRIDRLYLQENILNDDFGWIVAKNKNNSYWGMSKISGETHFSSTIRDLIDDVGTSRAYSINFYIDNQIVYYKRYYKKINVILSESYPIAYLIFFTVKKIAQILKIAEGKEKMTELLFEKLNDKPKIIKVMESDQKNEQSSNLNSKINIKNNFNLRIYDPINKSNHNKLLVSQNYEKINNRSDKSKISSISLFNSKKSNLSNINNIYRSKKNNNNYISHIIYVHNKNDNVKQLFPYRYYLFSEFIKNIDISQYYRCCFSKKFTKVYIFIGKLFDISSYLILRREFSIIKNYIFKQKELDIIEQDIKINLNDHCFMKDINDCIGGAKSNIFAKNIKEHQKSQ